MKKAKILAVGSFMMDLIASAPRVPNLGETVIGTSFQTAPGGKGANQALQCARLGADVTMVGCVGADAFGQEMCQALKDAGVDVSHVRISEMSSSGVGHIQLEVKETGVQNRILVVPGSNYDLMPEDLEWLKEKIREYDLLMLQLELRMDTITTAARIAHEAGVPVMLNPAPAAALSDELLSCLTYVSPNEHEAALLSGLSLKADEHGVDQKDLAAVVQNLCSRGIKKLMITLGSNGAVLCDERDWIQIPCVHMTEVKDPTAAGDSFVGAFCTGIAGGLSEKEALQMAAYTAAITVSGMGAMPSLPTLDRVCELMKERGAQELAEKVMN